MKHTISFILVLIFIMSFGIGCNKTKGYEPAPKAEKAQQTTVKLKNTLKIYCEEDQPREYLDSNGELTGMTVELVREIQKRVGNSDKINLVPWARGYEAIKNKPNVVLFSMARNAERDPIFQWVGPIDEIAYAFYGKADTPLKIESLEDAKKVKAIGVIKNEIRDIYLKGKGFTNLDYGDDTEQNYKKLNVGRIDLMPISTDQRELNSEVKPLGFVAEDFKMLYVFMRTQLYIAMSKDMPKEVVDKWNKALQEIKDDGTYEKIYHKYFQGKELPGPTITKFD